MPRRERRSARRWYGVISCVRCRTMSRRAQIWRCSAAKTESNPRELESDEQHRKTVRPRPHHSTEGTEQSGDSVRSARLVSHAYGTVLHTQPLPGPEVRCCLLPATYRWRSQESVFAELPGIACDAVRGTSRSFGVRRQ